MLHRAILEGESKQLYYRSEANGEYEPGTEPVSLDILGSYVFMEVLDITDTFLTPHVARFDPQADTVITSDTMHIELLCNQNEALVSRLVNPPNGRFDFLSGVFTEEPLGYVGAARVGQHAIVTDSSFEARYQFGCLEPTEPMVDTGRWGYSVDRYGHMHRRMNVSNGKRQWSVDKGVTWRDYPDAIISTSYTLLGDETWVGTRVQDPTIYLVDEKTGDVASLISLPDGAWSSQIIADSLADATLVVVNWPFADGTRGFAIVKVDLTTSVEESLHGDATIVPGEKWYVYDLLGNLVDSGTGEPELSKTSNGLYLLRQGNKTTKIIR